MFLKIRSFENLVGDIVFLPPKLGAKSSLMGTTPSFQTNDPSFQTGLTPLLWASCYISVLNFAYFCLGCLMTVFRPLSIGLLFFRCGCQFVAVRALSLLMVYLLQTPFHVASICRY